MQLYNKYDEREICIKIKSLQTLVLIMVRPNLTYTHLPQALIALRIPLFQCFQPKLANLKLDYDSNKIFWTYDST